MEAGSVDPGCHLTARISAHDVDTGTSETGGSFRRGEQMTPWKLKRVVQCAHCPWRKDVDPRDIPNGYSEAKHAALSCTIAKPGDVSGIYSDRQQVMACHETHDAHCIGWLSHQIGAGNNIALRIQMMACENARHVRTVGEQHETFAETLPR